ncbi:kievitone hydratase [Phlyctema vagabunda]|uniref:Kievitone hydratase n=1 Tax=Phlyctema vagabunda TaxID=108571 RepID=A0ABR4P1Z6_9HELO
MPSFSLPDFITTLSAAGAKPTAKYIFEADNHESYRNSRIPALVDLSKSQYDADSGTSYWLSSFITGTNNKQYLALSHVLTKGPVDDVCRSSVLDLATLEYWVHLEYCLPQSRAYDTSQPLSVDFGSYTFGSTSNDSISNMYATVKTNASFSFDLQWETKTKVLLNGGAGVISFGPGPTNATELGFPGCKSTGSLTLNGTDIAIDPARSFTWYDRQLSYGAGKNWTWFEVNFPGTDIKASIWSYLLPDDTVWSYATVRRGESILVLAYDLVPDMSNVWVSPKSNFVYPLSWRLNFENGDFLDIVSVRADQEMYGPNNLVDSAYEGFITVSGKFLGQAKGFGVVELVTIY